MSPNNGGSIILGWHHLLVSRCYLISNGRISQGSEPGLVLRRCYTGCGEDAGESLRLKPGATFWWNTHPTVWHSLQKNPDCKTQLDQSLMKQPIKKAKKQNYEGVKMIFKKKKQTRKWWTIKHRDKPSLNGTKSKSDCKHPTQEKT